MKMLKCDNPKCGKTIDLPVPPDYHNQWRCLCVTGHYRAVESEGSGGRTAVGCEPRPVTDSRPTEGEACSTTPSPSTDYCPDTDLDAWAHTQTGKGSRAPGSRAYINALSESSDPKALFEQLSKQYDRAERLQSERDEAVKRAAECNNERLVVVKALQILRESVNAKYWESIRDENGELRCKVGELNARIATLQAQIDQSKPRDIPPDSIVEKVVNRHRFRAETGLAKYGFTMDRPDLSLLQWLTHLQEECMDAAVYIERLRTDLGEPTSVGRMESQSNA